MDFGPTVLLSTTSATPSAPETNASMAMGASKSTMTQHHHPHPHPNHHSHHHHHHHHHHPHHHQQPPTLTLPQQQQQQQQQQQNHTSPSNKNSNHNCSQISSTDSSAVANHCNSNTNINTVGLISASGIPTWNLSALAVPEDSPHESNLPRSPANCSVTVRSGLGQRNSCSMCQQNCASLTVNSCTSSSSSSSMSSSPAPPLSHSPIPTPPFSTFPGSDHILPHDSPNLSLLNSDTTSVLPRCHNSCSNQNAHPTALSNSCLSRVATSDQMSIKTITSNADASTLMTDSNQARLEPSAEETVATVHHDPFPDPTRTKCSGSSSKLSSTARTNANSLCSPDDDGHGTPNVFTHHQLNTAYSTNTPLCVSVREVATEQNVANHHSVHIIPNFNEAKRRFSRIEETPVNANEDIKISGHVMMMMMVQRAGSVPNEATSPDNPYVTNVTETTLGMTTGDQIGPVTTKRGSIVNGAGEMGSDRRKSRQLDNVTELLSRRTLNGGSSLSLTADPRSRTCCFCWCCCCSCSCMRVRANLLPESKRPSASLDPQSRLDEISADERLTYEEVKSWGDSFDLLMQSSGE
ncbi:hypothetical protein D915_001610 [Fasciola hepatica]|uniref:Uncharacterized protein n=1 Tax=Fasciola hepatica TaxID=6192 RepID=A0A4E0RLQ2_FASHE|nr:hypothetical protein D915_001610 [Fasciola hepatica]